MNPKGAKGHMIQQKRLMDLFAGLVSIDNPSLHEAEMCARLKEELRAIGAEPREDDTAAKIGGNAGNLYAYFEGEEGMEPLLLSAHMDSVEPACGKRAVFREDGTITSDGTTVLGADCLSGVAAILEALRSVKESGAKHRPIEVLFDAAEETYCAGIQRYDFASLRSKEAYIFDLTGRIGGAAVQAPTILSYKATFHGRAAHAAFSPENGIHAIQAAACAVSKIRCGRVGDTTVNVGTISGGSADNVVPETCVVTGEVRSFDDASARAQLAVVRKAIEQGAEQLGAAVDFEDKALCRAYLVDKNEPVVRRFEAACKTLGVEPELVSTYGGSDNNHFFHHGVRGVVVACGMNNCHSCGEYSSAADLTAAAKLVETLILSCD